MGSTTSVQTTTKPTSGAVANSIPKVRKVTKRKLSVDQKIKIVLEGFIFFHRTLQKEMLLEVNEKCTTQGLCTVVFNEKKYTKK